MKLPMNEVPLAALPMEVGARPPPESSTCSSSTDRPTAKYQKMEAATMALRMADRPSNSRPFVSPSELSLVYIRRRWHFHNSELLCHYQAVATGWIWMALCGVRIVAEQNYHHRPPSTVADFINAMMDGLKRTLLHFSMVTTWHARFFTHVYRSAYLAALC